MKVLVATDGSESSMKAVKRALELAEKEGADITLMSVAYYSKDDFDDMPPGIQDKLEDQAADALKKAKALFDKKGVKVETVLEAGVVPANNIINRAKEGKIDRIIMGSTGMTGLKRALMGSTAAKVVAYAPCSVTIMR
ncbi:MAG: universal stress protein [Thermodesulfobacteriota bacterium]|nr:universal stress protein [Thermodesulfobacteriota bacterium]